MATIDVRKTNHKFRFDASSDRVFLDGSMLMITNGDEDKALCDVDDVDNFILALRVAAYMYVPEYE